mmetsp:Transcript_29336/g.44195  ORF Transcript_29336/g.44195 Transcript_29336/m.44195 type:complete len:244 (-) Transcript_29336:466-1197(-)
MTSRRHSISGVFAVSALTRASASSSLLLFEAGRARIEISLHRSVRGVTHEFIVSVVAVVAAAIGSGIGSIISSGTEVARSLRARIEIGRGSLALLVLDVEVVVELGAAFVSLSAAALVLLEPSGLGVALLLVNLFSEVGSVLGVDVLAILGVPLLSGLSGFSGLSVLPRLSGLLRIPGFEGLLGRLLILLLLVLTLFAIWLSFLFLLLVFFKGSVVLLFAGVPLLVGVRGALLLGLRLLIAGV